MRGTAVPLARKPAGLRAWDMFNRADTVVTLSPADSRHTYSELGQVFGIASNKAKMTTTAPGNCFAVVNCGTPNVCITCTFTLSTTLSNAGIAARVSDVSNGMFLNIFSGAGGASNGIYMNSMVAGADNYTLQAVGVLTLGATYNVEWTIIGLYHTVRLNNVTVIAGAGPSSVLNTNTFHGLWCGPFGAASDSGEARWENLSIRAV